MVLGNLYKCSRCNYLKPFEEMAKDSFGSVTKSCRRCKINRNEYRCKVITYKYKQEQNIIRADLLMNFHELYNRYHIEDNRLFNLPIDVLKYILKFVYGYDDNPVLVTQYKCEVCKKILSRSNKAKHMRTHNIKLLIE